MAKAVPILSDKKLLDNCNPDNSFDNAVKSFSGMINLNVVALALCVRLAVSKMDHDFPGYIININSMSGHRCTTNPGTHFYTATKHAVTAVTEAVRQELRQLDSKIRVGQICPGFVDTEFFKAMEVNNENFDNFIEKVKVSALQCEDISNAVMMMVKSHARCQYGDVMIRPTGQLQ